MVDNQSSSRIKRKKGWHLTLWQPSITWLVEDHDRKNKNFVFIIGKRAKNSRDFRKGQNGQIPSILEIFCPKTLFRNNIVIYHFLWYSSLVSSSTIFFNTMWPNEMESLIKKNKNFGHLVLELGGLEYCSWYSSPSSSGTILGIFSITWNITIHLYRQNKSVLVIFNLGILCLGIFRIT